MELKENILEAAITVFNQKGLKFTMDDIAKQLSISKKTIYTVFQDKEALFLSLVEYIFDSIKESEQRILAASELTTLEKIRRILGVLPDGYKNVDFRQLYLLKDKYPKIYKQVELKLETGWEPTIALIEQGIQEGVIRPIPIVLVKTMLESAIEQFFRRDILLQNDLTYHEALDEVVHILVDGIRA